MGWVNGLPISVGELAGQFIGFSNMGYGGAADFNLYSNQNERYTTQQLEWLNTEFANQIDISEYFTPGHADFDVELAGINIVDENKNVTARFVCRLSKSGNQWHLNNRLENPSGAVIAYIMRSQSGNVTLSFDQTGNYATGIWRVYLALSVSTNGTDRAISWVVNDSQCGSKYGNYYFGRYGIAGSGFQEGQLWDTFGIAGRLPEGKKKSPEFGPSSEPGGGYNETSPGKGSFDDHSDLIELTPLPTYNPCDAQFLKVWLMDATDLAHIGDALFPQYDLTNLDILGTWKEIAEMLLNNKRIDYMLDLLIVPVEPSHATNKQHITCGGWPLSYFGNEQTPQIHYVDGKLVQNCYVEVDCESVTIPEYWANFLDFSGTKVKVFLPYIGYVDLQPEYVIGGELSIKYRFNAYDGSFMCYLFSKSGHSELNGSLIGQYAGVAAIHLPLQSQDYTQKISGLISSLGTVVAGAASGGISAAAAGGATANLTNTLVSKPGSSHANGYNASSSFLSHKRPYLIIERQHSQFSEKYPEEVGLPLNVMFTLGSLTGLTKCESAHLDTIPCSVEGKEKISQLLADGIIL